MQTEDLLAPLPLMKDFMRYIYIWFNSGGTG